MPHQCLKCGTLFPDGSTTILRGCPDCRGTRFFFTSDPIPLSERERLLTQAEKDLPGLLREVLEAKAPAPAAPAPPAVTAAAPEAPRPQSLLLPGNKLVIKMPRQVRQRVRRAVQWDYELATPPQPPSPPGPSPAPPAPAAPEPRAPAAPRESPIAAEAHPPETLRIQGAGEYEIDVKRLLEASPIVIQKDGTYLLHLPSIFESVRRPPPE